MGSEKNHSFRCVVKHAYGVTEKSQNYKLKNVPI